MAALPDEFALALAAVQALSEELFGLRTVRLLRSRKATLIEMTRI